MGRKEIWFVCASLLATAGFTAALLYWAFTGEEFRACRETTESIDRYGKTFAALDSIIDANFKLATGLAGVGAAVLIGLKTGVTLNPYVRTWLLISTIFFALSAFLALSWRFGTAQIWLDLCLDSITASRYQRPFQAHVLFFFSGLFSIGVVVVGAALARAPSQKGYDS
jgi:hypothetical protein